MRSPPQARAPKDSRTQQQFDALEDRDRWEVLLELLRRTALSPHDLQDRDDLTAMADRLLFELARHEQLRRSCAATTAFRYGVALSPSAAQAAAPAGVHLL